MAALITPPRCTRTLDTSLANRPDPADAEEATRPIPETPPSTIDAFEAVLTDGTSELVPGASAYAQEGHMTTFFRTAEDDPVIDAWSERIASIRTTEIRMIRRSRVSPSAN